MFAHSRIGVFIQRFAVEVCQTVRVFGEVRRHPVEDDADIVLMQVVNQVHEFLRFAIAAGRCIVAGDLISP